MLKLEFFNDLDIAGSIAGVVFIILAILAIGIAGYCTNDDRKMRQRHDGSR